MSTAIEMRVWIDPFEGRYSVKPLFRTAPVVEHGRLQTALERLGHQVQRRWRKVRLERGELEDLLWFAFAPNTKLSREPIALRIGQRFIQGRLPVVRFALEGWRYAMLPTADGFCFIEDDQIDAPFGHQLEVALERHLRARFKDDPGYDPRGLFTSEHAFISTITVRVDVERGEFSFERQAFDWSAALEGQQTFRGEVELNRVGDNLRQRYPDELARAYGRNDEVASLSALLFAEQTAALCLIGPLGSGRSTLIEEVFYRHCQGEPGDQGNRRSHQASLYHLDPTRVISGMSIVGQWERRFEAILDFVANAKHAPKRRHRLWIDNPVALLHVGKSAQSELTLKDVLKPYLEARQLTVLLEATPEEWQIVQAADRRFADLFQIIRLRPPGLADAVSMVVARRADLEERYGCRIEPAVITELFGQPRDRAKALPGAVVQPLTRLASKHRGEAIGLDELRPALAEDSGLAAAFVDPMQRIDGDALHRALSERLIAQPEAVDALIEVVHRLKAGLQNPDKPVATLLLIGPTGVGKTQAAKELARILFGDPSRLLRFDMNEYVSDADVGRLIGDLRTPEGLLTSPVRHRPFALVLLDEIEKAAPAIHDLLLQLLGEGRLTDSLGRTTDFSRTIVIMTSNLGARESARQLGFAPADPRSSAAGYLAAVEQFFRPEFVNRIDRVVPFRTLPANEAGRIAKLQIKALLERDGLVRRMTLLRVSEPALTEVIRRGFDPRLGGRSLRRALERDIVARVADRLVTLAPDQPILLGVDWLEGDLVSRIRPIGSAAAEDIDLSSLDERPRRERVDALGEGLVELRERIYRLRDRDDLPAGMQHALLRVQDEVSQLAEEVVELEWAIGQRRVPRASVSISARGQRQRWRRGVEGRPIDLAGRDDLHAFLHQTYLKAVEVVQQGHAAWLSWRIRADFARYRVAAIECGRLDRVELQVVNMIPGVGEEEAGWLARGLGETMHALGLIDPTVESTPVVQGYGIRPLLERERGLHLFHRKDGGAVPVRVALDGESEDQTELTVLRHYLLEDGDQDIRALVTDLRTQFVARGAVDANDWQLLWWLGLGGLVGEPQDS